MREIKFRGKDNDGNWHYGYPISDNNVDYDIYVPDDEEYHRVLGDAIGQYTGMKDRNGKEVYEGDVLNIEFHYEIDGRELCCDPYLGIAYYDIKKCSFCIIKQTNLQSLLFECYESRDFEVIGNIHDNPELLNK